MAAAFDSKWVTDSATVVNDIISTYYQAKAVKVAEEESRELAERLRQDDLRWKNFQMQLADEKLSFDKLRWGEAFGLTKQEYLDKRNAGMQALQRQGKLDALAGFTTYLDQNQGLKNQVVAQMGV